jgi:hypothetical protein
MPMIGRSQRSSATVWLSAFILGLAAGALVLVWPTAGLLVALGFAIPALISRRRVAAASGLLVGAGAAWLALIALAALRCQAFDARPGQECSTGDASTFVLVALALLAAGLGSVFLAVRR